MQRHRDSKARREVRLAASAVEFALIAPLMMLFTFGLVEIGRLTLVKQTATHASREGARIAVRPTAATSDVVERVTSELALLQISNASIETVPQSIEEAAPGTEVTVRVRIDIASVSWIPGYFNFGTSQIVAQSSMRRESTN